MNVPNPSPLPPLIINTVPTVGMATTVTGLSAVVGYGAAWLASKYQIPTEVVGGLLGLVFTGLTSIWHRILPRAPVS